jgi:AcrR family transcriptional regulator
MAKEKEILIVEAGAEVGAPCTAPPRPRERIVTSARDMFHRHGIRGVGVDAIAEAAGTNKMTLYRHFGSKDDLIVECLNCAAAAVDEIWREIEAANPNDPPRQLRDWIGRAAAIVAEDGRGCDFGNAAVELTEAGHPALRLIEDFKGRQRGRLAELCRAAGADQSDLLADALILLVEGARVSRRNVGAGGPSANFLRSCETVVKSFGVGQRPEPARNARAKAATHASRNAH